LSDRYPGIIEDFQYRILPGALVVLAVSRAAACEDVAVGARFDLPHAASETVSNAPISRTTGRKGYMLRLII
jgi:hypothetical protein